MPFYRFDIDSPLTAPKALERVRGLVRKRQGIWQWLNRPFRFFRPKDLPPFIGTVTAQEDTFDMRPDPLNSLLSRDSFPRIRGQIETMPWGTRIHVGMNPDLWVPALMIVFFVGGFWLNGMAEIFSGDRVVALAIPCLFVVVTNLISFFVGAIKARHFLERNLGSVCV